MKKEELSPLNREVASEVAENLDETVEDMTESIKEAQKRTRRARTVNGLMNIKKRLLVDLVDNLPLIGEHCYFCILDEPCEDCEYARIKGDCRDNDGSYSKVSGAREHLISVITEEYW